MARQKQLVSNYAAQGSLAVRLAEVVGGTTAECAAVCCLLPFGLVDLVLLATCKVPAGLYRKALRQKRRRRLMKLGLLPAPQMDFQSPPPTAFIQSVEENVEDADLDNGMFEQFFSGGFWRSSSPSEE